MSIASRSIRMGVLVALVSACGAEDADGTAQDPSTAGEGARDASVSIAPLPDGGGRDAGNLPTVPKDAQVPSRDGVPISGLWMGNLTGTETSADGERPVNELLIVKISPSGFLVPDAKTGVELSTVGQTLNSSINIERWKLLEIETRPDRLLMRLDEYRESRGFPLFQTTTDAYRFFVGLKEGESPEAAIKREEVLTEATRLFVQHVEQSSSTSSGSGITASDVSKRMTHGILMRLSN